MAYAMDLSRFSLLWFEEALTTAELIPSRRPLLEHIQSIVPRLEAIGVRDLEALRKLLANRAGYEELGEQLGVDRDYLTLLNREVNSYRTKPTPLAKLDTLSTDELAALASIGIRSTRNLYERCIRKEDRESLAAATGIHLERIVAALRMSDLVRINGVGPSFARFFLDLGVTSPAAVIAAPTDEIIEHYEESIAGQPNPPRLLPADIEYCKKFSLGLQSDIEW